MGWNSSVVLIANKTIRQVEKALPDVFAICDRQINWEDAISSALHPHAAIGEIPGWVALWSQNDQLVMFEEFLESASRGSRAVVCLQASVNTIHGFMVYENGKHCRTLVRENYEPVADVGRRLKEEASVTWDDDEGTVFDEDTVFEVVRLLTGVDVANFDTWEGVKFNVVELT
ncbi:MAG: DUF6461 domain-containing protein [Planctomycetia bacterium]|nr:DUF6461 domain-containing protein [Planctomycetia bacterium]